MYSVRAKARGREENEIGAAIAQWREWPHSTLARHGEVCCTLAREWALAMDHAELHGSNLLTGPRWLRRKHEWGPSPWPIHWCEAVERESLDCGALAAITHESYGARGVRSFPTQLIQRYSTQNTDHWHRRWNDGATSVHWITGSLIYHEACAVVVRGEEIGIWDPSSASWVDPQPADGYATTRAVRLFARGREASAQFNWGPHRVVPGRWLELGATGTGECGRGLVG